MAGNYAQLLDIINNPTNHSLPAWDNNNKLIEGLTIKQYLLTIIQSLTAGYQFMGVATPSTSPGTPDQNVFYIGGAGTYTNFGTSTTVRQGQICIFKWNGSWTNTPIEIANSGFVNVNILNEVPTTPYGGDVGARNAVPEDWRNYGVIIQYLLSDGWHISRFIGSDISDWTDITKWDFPFGDTVTNFFYEAIFTDAVGHIIFAVTADGNVLFGKGCPSQIKDLLDVKVDKEQGKSLLNAIIANGMSVLIANGIIDVTTDKTGKITEATYEDGTKLIPKLKTYKAELADLTLAPDGVKHLNQQLEGVFCNYIGGEFGVFNKCLCIGDSLTAGVFNYYQGGTVMNWVGEPQYSYPTFLKKISGVDVVNMGRGGFTSVDWYNEYQNTDLSGYDVALIQLGVNDAGQYSGGWTQASIDAFTNIINKLKTENKNIKIFVSTITPVTSYTGENIDNVSQGIRNLIKTLNDENVVLVDMARYGHTAESEAYNCQHLSAYGYWRLAKDWFNIISYLINSNKSAYREVQFIGTDYYYEH